VKHFYDFFFTGSESKICRDFGDPEPGKFERHYRQNNFCQNLFTLLQVEVALRFSAVKADQAGQFFLKYGKLVQLQERLRLYPLYSPSAECFQHQSSLSNQTRAVKLQ